MNSYAYMIFLIHGHSSRHGFHRLPSVVKVELNSFQSRTNKHLRDMFDLHTGPEEKYSGTFTPSCYPSLRYPSL